MKRRTEANKATNTDQELGEKYRKDAFSLLDKNPALSGAQIAREINCGETTAYRIKKQYEETHGIHNEKHKDINPKEVAFALLDENPILSGTQMAKILNCKIVTAKHYRREYNKSHPQFKIERAKKGHTQTVFALLDNNSTLSQPQLSQLTGYSRMTIQRDKKKYFEMHPEIKRQGKIASAVFSCLDKSPALSDDEIAKSTGCSLLYAHSLKQKWLKLHGAEPPQEDKEA